ncbi:hypothetical protein HDU97_003452 [Phlyctochytrium planicorne]|nr:hypothetical protein HDU97_003452 [Phlyctochytrium planicorne]
MDSSLLADKLSHLDAVDPSEKLAFYLSSIQKASSKQSSHSSSSHIISTASASSLSKASSTSNQKKSSLVDSAESLLKEWNNGHVDGKDLKRLSDSLAVIDKDNPFEKLALYLVAAKSSRKEFKSPLEPPKEEPSSSDDDEASSKGSADQEEPSPSDEESDKEPVSPSEEEEGEQETTTETSSNNNSDSVLSLLSLKSTSSSRISANRLNSLKGFVDEWKGELKEKDLKSLANALSKFNSVDSDTKLAFYLESVKSAKDNSSGKDSVTKVPATGGKAIAKNGLSKDAVTKVPAAGGKAIAKNGVDHVLENMKSILSEWKGEIHSNELKPLADSLSKLDKIDPFEKLAFYLESVKSSQPHEETSLHTSPKSSHSASSSSANKHLDSVKMILSEYNGDLTEKDLEPLATTLSQISTVDPITKLLFYLSSVQSAKSPKTGIGLKGGVDVTASIEDVVGGANDTVGMTLNGFSGVLVDAALSFAPYTDGIENDFLDEDDDSEFLVNYTAIVRQVA